MDVGGILKCQPDILYRECLHEILIVAVVNSVATTRSDT